MTHERITAQTCTGSLGDPIVNVSFGAGSNFGPPLPGNTTSSLQYQGATCPPDGYYSIVNYTSGCWPSDVVWHTATDHTGDANGYYMLVNASSQPSNFYIQTIDGLCAGTTYQFAAWLINMCSVTGIKPNITFTIEKTDGSILATYNSGDIPIINPVTWTQYGVYFTTPANITTVVLRMRNNAPGGIGNDLGLDDITFRPAGPAISTSIAGYSKDSISLCDYDTSSLHLISTVENCYINTAYQWQLSRDSGISWMDIAGATGTTYTRTTTAPGMYQYRLVVAQASNITISNCRVASKPILVTVYLWPVITISNSGPVCAGDSVLLTAAGGAVYSWTGPNSFIGTGKQLVINNSLPVASGKYFVKVTSLQGCINLDSTTVSVYALPVADFSFSSPACTNQLVSFTDLSLPGTQSIQQWSWDFGNGNTTNSSNASFFFSQSGYFDVSLQVKNDKGCKSKMTVKTISVHPTPVPDFTMPAICLADPFALFTNTSSISNGSQALLSYSWDFGDMNATPGNPNTSTAMSPQHIYGAVGVYPVKLTVSSAAGCSMDTIKNFTVNGSQPNALFLLDPAGSLCADSSVLLIDQSTVNFGGITRIDIWWDYKNDPSLQTIDSFPSPGKKYIHSYPPFSMPANKPVEIHYIAYSGISCMNEVVQTIQLKASPAIQFDSLPGLCQNNTPVRFTQANEINRQAGLGTYSGPGISNSPNFDPSVLSPGKYMIRYDFITTGGCSSFATQPIIIYPVPIVNAGPDKVLLEGTQVTLAATATGFGLQYQWTPNTSMTSNTVLTPGVSPKQDIVYTLKVVTADGCSSTDDVLVTVLKGIFIPTAFSPNRDGLNDTWRIPWLATGNGATMDVFNRYGQVVFHGGQNAAEWDGSFKGQPLSTGSYAWVLHTGIAGNVLYGMVTIVR